MFKEDKNDRYCSLSNHSFNHVDRQTQEKSIEGIKLNDSKEKQTHFILEMIEDLVKVSQRWYFLELQN